MDVLIKNIEILRNAPSRIYLFPNGTVNLNGEDIDAKVTELPPHGELKDVDKLLLRIDFGCCGGCHGKDVEGGCAGCSTRAVINEIKDTCTVLEAST